MENRRRFRKSRYIDSRAKKSMVAEFFGRPFLNRAAPPRPAHYPRIFMLIRQDKRRQAKRTFPAPGGTPSKPTVGTHGVLYRRQRRQALPQRQAGPSRRARTQVRFHPYFPALPTLAHAA